jgi:hypothetical protein
MKKAFIGLVLSSISLIACKKYHPLMPQGQPSISGTWMVNSVTTYYYDAAGLRGSNTYNYSGGPGNPRYNFDFNTDQSWDESYSASSQDPLHLIASGTYAVTSDSSFTLVYPNASPATTNEPCKILSLENNLFVFSKQLTTVFNGTDPGYIQYVFHLSK